MQNDALTKIPHFLMSFKQQTPLRFFSRDKMAESKFKGVNPRHNMQQADRVFVMKLILVVWIVSGVF